MFRLDSEDAVLNSFRPKDRATVELLKDMTLPRLVRHYLAWQHPSGGKTYLVFATPGGVPTGITFETNGGGTGAPIPHMCDWCHQAGIGTSVGLLTAIVNGRKRAGVLVCTDLSCQQKIEEEADRQGRSAVPQMEKLVERMGRFASEALSIDLSGAGR